MKKSDFFIGAGLILFCLLFFSFRAFQLGYSVPDEKRYIQSVREMVESRDWVTPRYHGKNRFEKPIFFYWLAAFSAKLFGLNIYACRFPSIIAGALAVLAVYLLGMELFERGSGIVSALFLATSPMFYMHSRFATPDMALLFFVTASVYFFIMGCKKESPHLYFYLFFFLMGLSMLTKGPVGVIVSILTALLFAATHTDSTESVKNMRLGVGVLIFLAVTLPWFLLMFKIHGSQYLNHIWKVETLDRVRQGIKFSDLFKAPFRYLLVVIVGNLPMSLFLIASAPGPFRFSKIKNKIAFLFGWLGLIFLFFSFIGTKKSHYMLLASPALALIAGETCFAGRNDFYKTAFFKIILILMTCIYTLALAAAFVTMNYMLGPIPFWHYFAIAAPLLLIWGWIRGKGFILPFILSNAVILVFVAGVAVPVLNDEPLLKFASVIESEYKNGDAIGVCSHVISHNRLSSYLDMTVEKVNVDLADPDAHAQTNKKLLIEFLNRDQRVFCVVTREDYEKYTLESLKSRLYILMEKDKWKKTNKIKFDQSLLSCILTGKRELLMKRLREPILLISNRKMITVIKK